ncbi:MAG: YceH family protein [Pseudomonadota bacterium]
MPIDLTAPERRVLGCLLEKSKITPDQYPLTLNALVQACNQKSSREPVMNLGSGEVERTARALEEQHLVRREENFRSRVDKFVQRFCNTPFSDYQFEADEFAVVTLLLLRGAQTPGELRARSGRLHSFSDNEAVVTTLKRLINHERGPLVQMLPRRAGRRDNEYLDCFSGGAAPAAGAADAVRADSPAPEPVSADGAAAPAGKVADAPASTAAETASAPVPADHSLADRVAQLELEVVTLRREVEALQRGQSRPDHSA